jgi:dethiobiotin synthetase
VAQQDESAASPEPIPITLVVGTETGVGKTWVTCALARALVEAGQRVVAAKPIQVGWDETSGSGDDGLLLAEATGQVAPRHALLRLAEHAAPAVAAERSGAEVDFEDLVTRMRSLAAPGVMLLVEGAGGLLSPLTWSDNHLDLAHSLDARVLLVASDRRGVINHTLLALRVLAAEKIPLVGVVLNQPAPPDPDLGSNAPALVRLVENVPVVTLPHLDDPALAAEAVKEAAGWLLP